MPCTYEDKNQAAVSFHTFDGVLESALPQNDEQVLIFTRKHRAKESAIDINIYIDGELSLKIADKEKLRTIATKGEHLITVSADISGRGRSEPLKITTTDSQLSFTIEVSGKTFDFKTPPKITHKLK